MSIIFDWWFIFFQLTEVDYPAKNNFVDDVFFY